MKSLIFIKSVPAETALLMNIISEYKGKQDLYKKQSPQMLKTLLKNSIIQSVESSNRIEGITVHKDRLKLLANGEIKPQNRSEQEIIGYKKALDLIHIKHSKLSINIDTIKLLHKIALPDIHDAGEWKKKDNEIIRKNTDGRIDILFKPETPKKTPAAMQSLCDEYNKALEENKIPALALIAALVFDFLCIHPFRDGNGRVSRLLTLLALYHSGFEVGKYISIEKLIEDTKDHYYEVLNECSLGWHTGKHSIERWVNYILGIIVTAYRNFEKQANSVKNGKGSKTIMILESINQQFSSFTLSNIISQCPDISRDMVKNVFKRLKQLKQIECLGKGQSAEWRKIVNEVILNE